MASESPEQTRRIRPRGTTEDMYEYFENERKKQGPPLPPSDKGPERRTPEGMMDRALVQRFTNGGCVMAGRGGKFKGSM